MRQFWAMLAHTAFGIAGSIVFTTSELSPATAQLPFLPNLQLPTSSQTSHDSDSQVVTTWVRLDGRPLFQLAAPRGNLPQRSEDIYQRLRNISQNYFQSSSSRLQVQVKTENNLPVIYVNNVLLLTVTGLDAKMQGEDDPFKLAQRLSQSLEQNLIRAKLERQSAFLARQSGIAAGIFVGVEEP